MNIVTHDNMIECSHCGNGANVNEYYDFIPFDDNCNIPVSPVEWMKYERQEIIKEIRKDDNYSLKFTTSVGHLPQDHYLKGHDIAEPYGKGEIEINHSGLHFNGHLLDGSIWKFDLDYKGLYTLSIPVDMKSFAIYIGGQFYLFYDNSVPVGKSIMVVEEMHRLHVNYWKNFPWFSYMYEEDK